MPAHYRKRCKRQPTSWTIQLHVLHASAAGDFDAVFTTLRKLNANALVIGTDPLFNSGSDQLAALAIRYAVPTIYQYRAFAAAGGLLSYGGSSTEPFRQAGYLHWPRSQRREAG